MKPGQALTQELALSDAQYVLVYRQQGPTLVLPKTGELPREVLTLLGSLALVGAVISLVKRGQKTMVKVVLLTSLGAAALQGSTLSALDVALKRFLTTSHWVTQGSPLPSPQEVAEATFYAYARLEDLVAIAEQAPSATLQPQSVSSPALGEESRGIQNLPVAPTLSAPSVLPTTSTKQDAVSVPQVSQSSPTTSLPVFSQPVSSATTSRSSAISTVAENQGATDSQGKGPVVASSRPVSSVVSSELVSAESSTSTVASVSLTLAPVSDSVSVSSVSSSSVSSSEFVSTENSTSMVISVSPALVPASDSVSVSSVSSSSVSSSEFVSTENSTSMVTSVSPTLAPDLPPPSVSPTVAPVAQPVETTRTEAIAFETEIIADDSLPLGEEVIVQTGVDGVLTHTYLDDQLVSSTVTTPAIKQIIRRGTKVAPVAQPVETTRTEVIAFETEIIADDSLPLGEEVIVQTGVDGVLTHTYLDDRLVSSTVTTPAI